MYNKRKAQIYHTIKRARQRFGIKLTSKNVKDMGKRIRLGKSEPIRSANNNRTFHKLDFKGKEMAVLYDKKRKVPITVMPYKWIDGS